MSGAQRPLLLRLPLITGGWPPTLTSVISFSTVAPPLPFPLFFKNTPSCNRCLSSVTSQESLRLTSPLPPLPLAVRADEANHRDVNHTFVRHSEFLNPITLNPAFSNHWKKGSSLLAMRRCLNLKPSNLNPRTRIFEIQASLPSRNAEASYLFDAQGKPLPKATS